MCFKAFIHVRVQRGKSEMLIAEQTLDEGSWVGNRPRDWYEVFAILIKEVSMYLSYFSYILLLLTYRKCLESLIYKSQDISYAIC